MNTISSSDRTNMTAAQLCTTYEVADADLAQIRAYGQVIRPKSDVYIEEFYGWLRTQPEFDQFISSEQQLTHIQELQRQYWIEFFTGIVDEDYVKSRRTVGNTHARIGLSLDAYFAAMNRSLRLITETMYDGSLEDQQYAGTVRSITKLVHLDTAVVVAAFSTRTNQIITEQHEAMLEMSTPVTEIWNDILMLPIVGIIDSKRAQEIMATVLAKISDTHACTLILDISGVGVVDTAVANHLIKITKATQLMGCRSIISGLSPAIAQTIVELGINVGDITTTSTLKDALEISFRESGVQLTRSAV